MTDELETIVEHVEITRRLHPRRLTDYLPRKDLQWLIDEVRRLREKLIECRGSEFHAMHQRMVELHAGFEEADPDALEQPTDQDLVTDHPYVPSEWGDICAHLVNGWPCGFGVAEHAADPNVLEQLEEAGGRLIVDKDGEA